MKNMHGVPQLQTERSNKQPQGTQTWDFQEDCSKEPSGMAFLGEGCAVDCPEWNIMTSFKHTRFKKHLSSLSHDSMTHDSSVSAVSFPYSSQQFHWKCCASSRFHYCGCAFAKLAVPWHNAILLVKELRKSWPEIRLMVVNTACTTYMELYITIYYM